MRVKGLRILRFAPDTERSDGPELRGLNLAFAPEQGMGSLETADGGSGMISALLRRWRKLANVEETRIESGEIHIHVLPATDQLTITVAGRVTVDSSPHLRSVLLDLLRRAAVPVVVIDFSAVTYLETSGVATLLEALKAAHENSVRLRAIGIIGQAGALAEIVQLDAIFRSLGSEVEFR